MGRRLFRSLLVALAIAMSCWLASCAVPGANSARVLDSGVDTLSMGGDISFTTPNLSPDADASLPSVQASIEYRHGLGIGRGADVGVRAWGLGIRGLYGVGGMVDARLGLKQVGHEERGWDLAMRLGAGYHQLNIARVPTHLPTGDLAFLFGPTWADGNHFGMGLLLRDQVMLGPDVHPVNLAFWGLTLMWERPVRSTWLFIPQMVLMSSPVSFNGTVDDPERSGLPVMQLAFTVRRRVR